MQHRDNDDSDSNGDENEPNVGVAGGRVQHENVADVTADIADLVHLRGGVARARTTTTTTTTTAAAGARDNVDGDDGAADAVAAAERQRQLVHQRNSEAARARGGRNVNTVVDARQRLMRDLRALQQSMMQASGATAEGGSGGSSSSSGSGSSSGGGAAATPLGGLCMSAHPVNDDIFHWHAVIAGPVDTPWEGGLFRLDLQFSERYPVQPPSVRFLTRNVFHPNVYVDGNICLDTLKSSWSPMLDVQALLLSITSLLSDPNPASAANGEAARLLTESKERYNRRVRHLVEESLMQSFSDEDDDEEQADDG